MELRKATRQKTKLRIGLSAPSGAGKTYSAILLAEGLATKSDKICLIDTENGRGDLYSHLNNYNVITLTAPFTPERYIQAMKEAEDAGMEVIIVDSISHEWEGSGGLLESNELLAKAKYKGNTWSAWSETTPRHQKFIEAIIRSNCHIITTVRNKIDTIMTEDKKVKKVGTKEITREGFEYEVTINFNIDRDTHTVMVSKDNTELFENKDPFIITTETGKQLKDWAELGIAPIKPIDPNIAINKNKIMALLKMLGIQLPTDPAIDKKAFVAETVKGLTGLEVSNDANLAEIVERMEIVVQERKEAGGGSASGDSTEGLI